MSLLGDVLKKVTTAAAELGETMVDGITDLVESVTGENQVTKAARVAGMTVVRGARHVAEATIDVGEAVVDTILGRSSASDDDRDDQHGVRSGPQAPDFVEPAQG